MLLVCPTSAEISVKCISCGGLVECANKLPLYLANWKETTVGLVLNNSEESKFNGDVFAIAVCDKCYELCLENGRVVKIN